MLWEADVGSVHGPHLLHGSSGPAESLLSWGSRKMGKCLPRCLQVLAGQGGIWLFVPATFLLAPCPTKPRSCILGKAGEGVSPGDHHQIAEQEPAPTLPVQWSASTPGRIGPSSLPSCLCSGARRGPWELSV